jgi:alpha-tubulin suppressor-like RCC1 family protein
MVRHGWRFEFLLMFGGLSAKISALASKLVLPPVPTRSLFAWGSNVFGSLGLRDSTERSSPVQVGNGIDWSVADHGSAHAHAIKTGGTLWAWGNGADGRLGNSSATTVSSPVQVGAGTDWSSVSDGERFAVAIKTTGSIWSWGYHYPGATGQNLNSGSRSSPVQIGSSTDWSKVSCGRRHALAIKTDGSLWGWGGNTYGRVGNNSSSNLSSPVQIGTGTDWSMVSAGRNHSAAIKTGGTLWSWGRAAEGQLGHGNTTVRSSPVQVGSDTTWSKVSTGSAHTIALRTNGTIWSWGNNSYGQLGHGNTTSRSSPVQVGTGTDWSGVKSMAFGCIAYKTNGTLWSWGRNVSGVLGLGYATTSTNSGISSPVLVDSGTSWTSQVAASYASTMAIKSDGTLWGWGHNQRGNLGTGNAVNAIKSPVQVGSDTNWSKVDANSRNNAIYQKTVAVKTNGTLWVWGDGSRGEMLTNAYPPVKSSPIQVGTATNWTNASCGGNFIIAINSLNQLWSWGSTFYGQLGNGTKGSTGSDWLISPVQVLGSNWSSVSCGSYHAAAIKTDGTLWSWGRNNNGQIGHGIGYKAVYSSPVQIGSSANWSRAVSNTGRGIGQMVNHTMLIKTDGTLWACGFNGDGRLGLGDVVSRSSPVQVGTGTDWASVSCGDATTSYVRGFTAAIKTGGTLWTWGDNSAGQLGHSNVTSRSSPVQVGTDTNWSSVKCGYRVMLALKTNGTIWSWGTGGDGTLGNGSTSRSSPVQIGSGTDWATIEAGQVHCMAIKTGGTLWAWGQNGGAGQGRLGTGNTVSTSSPVQVGADTNWSKVSVSRYATTAIKTNGTMWSWGRNASAALGIGLSYGDRSSPVQVGTDTDWANVSRSYNHGMAIKTGGSLWGWGSPSYGVLGLGNSVISTQSKPIQVGSLTNWSSVMSASRFGLGIKTDGTLWSWGRNLFGEALFPFDAHVSSPVQVGTGTSWASVDCGHAHSLAVKTDGTLWAWGLNSSGQLGIGNLTSRSSPVQVGVASDWSTVKCGRYFSLGLKTGGTLWAWGGNSNGRLGLRDATSRSVPVQVGSLSNWSGISGGNQHSMFQNTSGNLFGAGLNSYGRIRTSFGNVSSPVQVGTGTNWSAVFPSRIIASYQSSESTLAIEYVNP